jgi:hypothetical protein
VGVGDVLAVWKGEEMVARRVLSTGEVCAVDTEALFATVACSTHFRQPDRCADSLKRLLKSLCVVLWHDRQVIEQGPIRQERRINPDAFPAAERRTLATVRQ